LTLIADELAKFPPSALQEPILDMNDDAIDQISAIKSRMYDLSRETEKLEQEEEILKQKLADAQQRQAEVKKEWERYKHLIASSTFEDIDRESIEARRKEEEELIARGDHEHDKSISYNELWGANKFLKGETEKLQAKINEQRAYHEQYIAKKAIAQYDAEHPIPNGETEE
jgi:regulator of replication initiation timing